MVVNPNKLAAARRAILTKHGQGAIISMNGAASKIEAIPTGSFLLDTALGVGGFPRGRLIEIYGTPSSGKSTLTLATVGNCQRLGLPALYLDYENAFSPDYAKALGVNLDDDLFILSQPDHLEQGLNILETFIEQDLLGLCVVDSLAAMVPKAYLEGEIGGDKRIAEQARVMSQALQRLTPKIHRHNVAVVFINHVHTSIGGMPGRPPRKTTPGGDALKFYASVRVELQPNESIPGRVENPISGKMEQGPVALKVRALVVKNKLAPPYREGFFYLRPEVGLSEIQAVIEVGQARGVIRRNGSRYILPFHNDKGMPVNLGGIQAVLDYLSANPERAARLQARVIEVVGTRKVMSTGTATVAPTPDGATEIGFGEVDEESEDNAIVEDVTDEKNSKPTQDIVAQEGSTN